MRNTVDKTGMKLQMDMISASDANLGMIEGQPYLSLKMRLLSAKSVMEKEGHFFYSIEELEAESNNCPKDSTVWLENEYWNAQLSTGTKYNEDDTFSSSMLNIYWYQEGGDPFEKLNKIISNLNFKEICRIEKWPA